MKYISIDLETTGLNPKTNDILEFGAVLDDLTQQKPLDELPRFHAYIRMEEYTGQPYALSMHPQILRKIATREEPYQYLVPNSLGKMFQRFLVKNGYELEKGRFVRINVAGKNFGTFDLRFLDEQTNFRDSIRISHKILDPGILYLNYGDETIPGLQECLLREGIKKEIAHTAIEDALDVIKLIRAKLGPEFKEDERNEIR